MQCTGNDFKAPVAVEWEYLNFEGCKTFSQKIGLAVQHPKINKATGLVLASMKRDLRMFAELVSSMNIPKAKQGTSLAILRRVNKDFASEVLVELLKVTTNFLQVKTEEAVLIMIAASTVKEWYFLKIEELALICKMGSFGEFGSMYENGSANRFTPELFRSWLIKYEQQRLQHSETRHSKLKAQEELSTNLVEVFNEALKGKLKDSQLKLKPTSKINANKYRFLTKDK